MYKTTRNVAGDTSVTCKDCGHAISVNKICERPIQAPTDMLKHMAEHNASRAFAVGCERRGTCTGGLPRGRATPCACDTVDRFDPPIAQLSP
jgi:hypothetical protein